MMRYVQQLTAGVESVTAEYIRTTVHSPRSLNILGVSPFPEKQHLLEIAQLNESGGTHESIGAVSQWVESLLMFPVGQRPDMKVKAEALRRQEEAGGASAAVKIGESYQSKLKYDYTSAIALALHLSSVPELIPHPTTDKVVIFLRKHCLSSDEQLALLDFLANETGFYGLLSQADTKQGRKTIMQLNADQEVALDQLTNVGAIIERILNSPASRELIELTNAMLRENMKGDRPESIAVGYAISDFIARYMENRASFEVGGQYKQRRDKRS